MSSQCILIVTTAVFEWSRRVGFVVCVPSHKKESPHLLPQPIELDRTDRDGYYVAGLVIRRHGEVTPCIDAGDGG